MGNFFASLADKFSLFNVTKFPFLSYHSQNYFGIVIYLLLAGAICGLLAALAYYFSLSSVQDSEKRSEYECGFEPFDSATRLPFDVHFYLVGILFLIFDVEIALLFPWVLGLHASGWFSFYVVLGFIVLLGVGFLYEWKRGALIWPSRQTEAAYTPQNAAAGGKLSSLPYLAQVIRYNRVSAVFTVGEQPLEKKLALYPRLIAAVKKLVLVRRIRSTRRLFLARRLSTLNSYIRSAAYAGAHLSKYRKVLYFFIKKVLALSASCRVIDPMAERKIVKSEQAVLSVLVPVAREYGRLALSYKRLYKKFKTSALLRTINRLPRPGAVKVLAMRRYLLLQYRFFGQRSRQASKEKRALRKMINPRRKHRFTHGRFNKRFVGFVPLFWEISDFHAPQLLINFLPETLLLSSMLMILTFLAIELGAGRSKRELASESFSALATTLIFVIALYTAQLLFGETASLFSGYAVTSTYVVALKLLTTITGRFILVGSSKYMSTHTRHLLEYPIVLTLAVLFMLLLVGSNHLVSSFISLVGFSLNLYVLILFDATSAVAREAGVKYFYLSTISSGLILYGIFLVYVVLGTGHFYEMHLALSSLVVSGGAENNLLSLGIVFMLTGLFFKLSAFPGHLWAAEVYEGSPDPITAFFMLPVKVAVLGFTVQLFTVALEPASAYWQPIVAVSAVISLVWGCFAALAEKKTKRFLAYASINQIGLLLLGLSTASAEGYRATLLYLLLYAVMNIGFLTIFLNARRPDGLSLAYLTDFRGFGARYRAYSWSAAVVLLSMAGIPPLAGFFGKYYLLLHAQEQGLSVLVIAGLATSVVSTYYYLRLIKIFWFEGSDAVTPVTCDLSPQQASLLNLAECFLWMFSVYAVAIALCADACIFTLSSPDVSTLLLTFNNLSF